MQAPQNVQAPPTPGIEFRQLIGAEDGCPSAVLFRQVATPNYELRSFLRASRRLGLRPVILTYHQDRMSHRNLFKRSLVAPMFIEGTNRLSQPIWRRRPVINVETVEKVRLAEIVMGDTQLTALPSASLEPPADQKPRVGYRNLTGSPVLVVADALIGQPREHATHEAVDDRGHSSQVDATQTAPSPEPEKFGQAKEDVPSSLRPHLRARQAQFPLFAFFSKGPTMGVCPTA